MHLVADAIVLSTRTHGEHGVVARALTRDDGVRPGYVRATYGGAPGPGPSGRFSFRLCRVDALLPGNGSHDHRTERDF